MNRKLSDCIGYTVRANDGDVGRVERFYFDDLTWVLRYVAIIIEGMPDRHVLIPIKPWSANPFQWQRSRQPITF